MAHRVLTVSALRIILHSRQPQPVAALCSVIMPQAAVGHGNPIFFYRLQRRLRSPEGKRVIDTKGRDRKQWSRIDGPARIPVPFHHSVQQARIPGIIIPVDQTRILRYPGAYLRVRRLVRVQIDMSGGAVGKQHVTVKGDLQPALPGQGMDPLQMLQENIQRPADSVFLPVPPFPQAMGLIHAHNDHPAP